MSKDSTTSKRPTHIAYSVREYQANGHTESDWTRVGAVWEHRSGEGFDLLLDAIPVSGRVVIRKAKPKSEQA